MKFSMKPRFISHTGRQGANARILSENARRRIEARHRRVLSRTGAWTRGYIRRSMKRGRKKKKYMFDHANDRWQRTSKNMRVPSKPGSPPNYHTKGKEFGLKWIRFETDWQRWQVVIGPEFKKTKGSWRSKFHIASHLESGGHGKILVPQLPASASESWRLYHTHLKHGSKIPKGWVSAYYPQRPYVEPARPAALEFFRREYKRETLTQRGRTINSNASY